MARPPQRRTLKEARNAFQADVVLIGEGEGARVRKDFSGRPAWARATVGRWSLAKEARALEALRGLGIAPQLVASEPLALEVEFVAGERLPKKRAEVQPGPEVFERLEKMLTEMRGAGVAHGDLRRANIFWNPEEPGGGERFIDFGTAIVLGERPGWLRRRAFAAASEIDRATLAKIKRGYLGGEESAEHYPWFLRIGRTLRRKVYRPLKRLLRG